MSDSMSPRRAAIVLDRCERQIFRMLKTGRLHRSAGGGITLASVEERLAGQKSTDISLTCLLKSHGNTGFNETVAKILRLVPPLSEVPAAARRLGLSCRTFQKLVDTGDVPVLEIGSTKFIPGGWLAEQIAAAYARPAERKA